MGTLFRQTLNNGYPFPPKWPLKMGTGLEASVSHPRPNNIWVPPPPPPPPPGYKIYGKFTLSLPAISHTTTTTITTNINQSSLPSLLLLDYHARPWTSLHVLSIHNYHLIIPIINHITTIYPLITTTIITATVSPLSILSLYHQSINNFILHIFQHHHHNYHQSK